MDGGWVRTTYPCVVGNDIVGEVTVAGEQVKDMKVGDRVGVGAQVWACLNKFADEPCMECATGSDAYCPHRMGTYNSKYRKTDGAITYGGYADYIRVTHEYAFKSSDSIPSDVAASLLCVGTTVCPPFKQVGIKPGDRVGIVGIGALGHLGIQFAKGMGAAAVVAFSRSANKEQEVRRLGADEFVVYTDEKQAKEAANSVDILLITADANNMPYTLFLSFLAVHGTVIMVGLPNDEIKFKPFPLVGKGANFKGSAIGSIQDTGGDVQAQCASCDPDATDGQGERGHRHGPHQHDVCSRSR
jgi:alcohol dehydrogenase (NADP+)